MARIRSANPCAPVDEDVATMSLAARYVWAYLPCHADRDGRMKDSPFTIKANILPADNVDMNAVLDELAEKRHIIRYQVDGRRFIQIRSFHRHQSPHKREVQSVIPCPPGWLPMAPVHNPEEPGPIRVEADPLPASVSPSPSIPDPDPDPDLRSPLTPSRSDLDQAPAGARSNGGAKIWSVHEWRDRFGRAWVEKYQRAAYGDAGDTKACLSLGDVLAALPDAERLSAQAKAPEMFAEFLASAEPRVVSRRHPFVFFAQEWGGLRVPKQAPSLVAAPVARGLDPRCLHHAKGWTSRPKPLQPGCPRCDEIATAERQARAEALARAPDISPPPLDPKKLPTREQLQELRRNAT